MTQDWTPLQNKLEDKWVTRRHLRRPWWGNWSETISCNTAPC